MENKKYIYDICVEKSDGKVIMEYFSSEIKAKERLAVIEEVITTFDLWNEVEASRVETHELKD